MSDCPGHDPLCPCQDGLVCHYVDDPVGGTKAMPMSEPKRCEMCGEPLKFELVEEPSQTQPIAVLRCVNGHEVIISEAEYRRTWGEP